MSGRGAARTYTAEMRDMLTDAGVQPVRLPPRSPNLNELRNHVIPLGERHLRWLLREYVVHYNHHRPHQGIGNGLIEPTVAANGRGPIQRRTRAGGLLRSYSRKAA